MGNSYFQFKQFVVHQDKTAMKVCTDACLFGAYMADFFSAKNVLDIGAGTGLLDLMYLQKNPSSHLTSIEIDADAAAQATQNVDASTWKDAIEIKHIGLQQYEPESNFDLIFSNPPFFNNDLKSQESKRNMAMHSTELSLEEIFSFAKNYLNKEGKLALLLPYHRTIEAETTGNKNDFFLSEKVLVRQTYKHDFFRSIVVFSFQKTETITKEITIKNVEGQYDDSFVTLLKNYYLFL